MTTAMPATRAPGPDSAGDGNVRTNPELRDKRLHDAETVITDFVGHTDDELRAAADLIISTSHHLVDRCVMRRARFTLAAIGFAKC